MSITCFRQIMGDKMWVYVVWILFNVSIIFSACNSPPNIVFVLTDDQDVVLGGQAHKYQMILALVKVSTRDVHLSNASKTLTPMKKTKKLIGDEGIIFNNMFVTSPLCCPSRSSILTGKYVHNHGAWNNSVSGNCSSQYWQKTQETRSFSTYLKNQGYKTFFAGKYLNQYGKKDVGGVNHVPPGWDWWYGLVGNSRYYNYSLSVNGTLEKHGSSYKADYLTDVINRRAAEFLQQQHETSGPFFMMLSTPACHSPFTPALQYNNTFSKQCAPRDKSFNVHGKDKHWLIRKALSPMPSDTITCIDGVFRNRWRTLLSVDDMVENVITLLEKQNIINNTYIFFSSDNGYHLGQFSLPYDKRQLYEFDIRVPLMIRGPGIKPNQTRQDFVLNIDLAPTFVSLAGVPVPKQMDGQSIVSLLHKETRASSQPFKNSFFLVEHKGEASRVIPNCPQYNNQGMDNCDVHCVCEDSWNNTYGCVHMVKSSRHLKYCVLQDTENFVEIYDLIKDPWELVNIVHSADPQLLTQLNKKLADLSMCSGFLCHL